MWLSVRDYPVSWTSTVSLTAVSPWLSEFMPILSQMGLILSVQMVTVLVDWVRKKLKLKENKRDSMDILKELERNIKNRKKAEKD